MDNLVSRAMQFATAAHEAIGQKRKYTGAPYITHPAAVVAILMSVPPHTVTTVSDEVLAAAWLHDVVEDTQITLQTIQDFFGPRVRDLVYWLTDKSKPGDGNRANRKAIDRAHIAEAPAAAQNIKLADLIDNTETIVRYDSDFATVYLREKAQLLDAMRSADPALMARAREIMEDAWKDLALLDQ